MTLQKISHHHWHILLTLSLLISPPLAAQQTPEIQRNIADAIPQPIGQWHNARQIPEACVRIEGNFTADPANPYQTRLVQSRPNCQPRARFVDYDQAQPQTSPDWILNDIVRIPSSTCPNQQAVLHVWRKPIAPKLLEKDGQGQIRLYLDEAKQQAETRTMAEITEYAADIGLEGTPCQ